MTDTTERRAASSNFPREGNRPGWSAGDQNQTTLDDGRLNMQKDLAQEETTEPQRIQLSRTKGWKMPPNTVKVDRTTKWGNPFVIGKPGGAYTARVVDRRHAYLLFKSIAADNAELVNAAKAELRGKNLACWCPHDDPYEDACHAAVLMEIANG